MRKNDRQLCEHWGRLCDSMSVIKSSKCVLNNNCKILDNSVVAPDTVIPSFTVYGGKPAVYLGELTEAATCIHRINAITYYQRMHVKKKKDNKK